MNEILTNSLLIILLLYGISDIYQNHIKTYLLSQLYKNFFPSNIRFPKHFIFCIKNTKYRRGMNQKRILKTFK